MSASRQHVVNLCKRADLSFVVALSSVVPLVGYAVVVDLIQLYRDELTVPLGALSALTMRAVSAAIRVASP